MDSVICCHPPVMTLTHGQSRRAPDAMWWLASDLPLILHDALRAAIASAAKDWCDVAGVTMGEALTPGVADLVITAGRIDGPFGILAATELPGPIPQHMTIDSAEAWVVHLGSDVPGGKIDVSRVLAHELGHFWGLEHAAPGSPNLMAPVYSLAIDGPQAWDVGEMQARYGPPKVVPPAPPPPSGDEPATLVILNAAGKETARFALKRIS